MYDFQSAMAEGKARAQRERNRGASSAVRLMTTEELYMGMTEQDWLDWQEEQASSVDDIEADMAIAELAGEEMGTPVDAGAPVAKRKTEDKSAQPRQKLTHGVAKTQAALASARPEMTATTYRLCLEKLGLSPYAAAPHLGISRSLSFRYAAGSHPISPPVAKLVCALVKLGSLDV